jgi:hypothetical protein
VSGLVVGYELGKLLGYDYRILEAATASAVS